MDLEKLWLKIFLIVFFCYLQIEKIGMYLDLKWHQEQSLFLQNEHIIYILKTKRYYLFVLETLLDRLWHNMSTITLSFI